MSVHYKFRNSVDHDIVHFDGVHISVADFKKAVMQQKRLSSADCDYQITDAKTKEGKCLCVVVTSPLDTHSLLSLRERPVHSQEHLCPRGAHPVGAEAKKAFQRETGLQSVG